MPDLINLVNAVECPSLKFSTYSLEFRRYIQHPCKKDSNHLNHCDSLILFVMERGGTIQDHTRYLLPTIVNTDVPNGDNVTLLVV